MNKKKQSRVALSTFVALLLMSSALSSSVAEGSASNDLTNLSLEELMNMPVYAASSREQKIEEAPAFVTIIPADDIKKYGYRTLADIIKSVSGFYVTTDRNYSYVGVRGFERPGDYNTRILLLINGMRMNDAIYDLASIGEELPIDVNVIERVEIVRGPTSSVYGTDAMLAVVNVITRPGRSLQGGELSFETGSYDMYKGVFTCGGRRENGLEVLVSGSIYKDSGRDLYYPEFDALETHYGVPGRASDKQKYKDFFLSLRYKDLSFQAGQGWRQKHVPTAAWDTVFGDSRTYTLDRLGFAELCYEPDLNRFLSAALRVAYNNYDYLGDYVYDYGSPETPYLVLNRDISKGSWLLYSARVATKDVQRNKITCGAELRDNFRQIQQNYDLPCSASTVYMDYDRSSSTWALYAEDEIEIHSRLLANVGMRWDHLGSFGWETSPRAALIFRPVDGTAAKLLYGQAFRSPSSYESSYKAQGVESSEELLEPEEITTYEVVLEQRIGEHLQGTVSAFRYDIDHLIDQKLDLISGNITFRNRQEVRTDGMQVAMLGKTDNGVEGRVSLSLQYAVDRSTDEDLDNSPRALAKAGFSVPLFSRNTSAGFEAQYVAHRKTLAGNTVDGFTVANLTVFSRNILPNMDATASIYNLFNEKYYDPGGQEHVQDAIEQDGRTFRVKLTYRF